MKNFLFDMDGTLLPMDLNEFGVVIVAVGEDDILDLYAKLIRLGERLARRISAVDYRPLEAFFVIDEIGIRAKQAS